MNTQTQEALKMAIEALEKCKEAYLAGPNWQKVGYDILDKSHKACKEAIVSDVTDIDVGEIAQPAQEPLGYIGVITLQRIKSNYSGVDGYGISLEKLLENDIPLYTHPALSTAQEPVAVCKDSIVNWVNGKAIDGWLYTHPAPPCQECENLKHDLKGYMDANKALINREWQGLSDDVVMQTYLFIFNEDESEPDEQVIQFYKLIDQELKTKNGFSDLKEKNNA